MRAIDTNVLVRLLARDDEKQTAAAERFVSAGAWVSHVVLVEACWVLSSAYGLRKEKIATAVEMLLKHAELTIQDADVVALALDRFRQRKAPVFSDCLILEIARKAGHLPIGTFDRRLATMDGAYRM